MQLLKRRRCGLFAPVLCVLCGWTLQALAQQPPAAPAPAKPTPVAVAAVRSADAVAKLAAQTGLPLPPAASPQGIEQQFPFIGPGGLATDKPAGMVVFGGPGIDPQKAAAILLPVKPTAATMEALKTAGGQPVPGVSDMVQLQEGFIRRTANYVILGSLPDALAQAREDALADLLKGNDALARVSVDLKAVRTAMPEQYKAFLDEARKNAAAVPGADAPGAKEGREWFVGLIDRLDQVDVGLDHGDKGLRLFSTLRPLALPPATPAVRPGLPPGILARLDLAAQPSQLLHVDDAAIDQLIQNSVEHGGKLNPKQRQEMKGMLTRLRTILLDASAVSVGVEMVGDAPVVYAVARHAKPIDYTDEVRHLVGHAIVIAAESHEPPPLDMQTFDAAGAKVLRLRMIDNAKPFAYIDGVQRGDLVYLTGSDKQFLFLDRLLAAKPEGPMQGLAEGWLDLGRIFDSVVKQPNSPLAGMPPEQQKQIADALKAQRLTLSATAEGDAATFDLTIPTGLIQNVPKVMGAMGR
jgi:hypothetical protein